VPQRLLASRHGAIGLNEAKLSPDAYVTVADAIGSLPAIAAGAIDQTDPLHGASRFPNTTWNDVIVARDRG
jgi:hypothetical protein